MSSQNWTIFRGHFYTFLGSFLRSTYRMRDIFWVAKISTIFLGVFEIPDMFLGVNRRCRAHAYV